MTGTEIDRTAAAKVPVSLVGQLNDLDQAHRYAQALALSSLLPEKLVGKPANVLAVMLYGQQIGLTPMQAIQSIYVVNGRPSMSGQLWLSKVREAGHAAYIPCTVCWQAPAAPVHKGTEQDHRYEPDHDEQRCSFTIVRKDSGEEHTETFTWEQAVKAKLTGKDVWKSWPKRMLMWRAVSNCATVICPEVALGFGAEDPEVDGGRERPTLGQVAAERTDRAVEQASPDATSGNVVLDEQPTEPAEDAEVVTHPDACDRLYAMKLGELRKEATNHGVTVLPTMDREDLIEAIQEAARAADLAADLADIEAEHRADTGDPILFDTQEPQP